MCVCVCVIILCVVSIVYLFSFSQNSREPEHHIESIEVMRQKRLEERYNVILTHSVDHHTVQNALLK